MTTHTGRPWHIGDDGLIIVKNTPHGDNGYSTEFICSANHKANANRIVHCVNMHEEMMEALKSARYYLQNTAGSRAYDQLKIVHAAITQATQPNNREGE